MLPVGRPRLPLAIELAAARCRLLPPQAILDRLDNPLDLLVRGPLDLPDRQQTLRATIAWSMDLLKQEEQILFRRLGVFRGGFTLESAGAVCQVTGEHRLDVLDGLTALVEHNLVRPMPEQAGVPRFTLLETIRSYALEQLEECGEMAAVQQAHACHFLALTEEAEPHLEGPEQVVWIARLEREHDNLRAALDWMIDRQKTDMGLRTALAMSGFWPHRGYIDEGRGYLTRLCAQPGASPTIWAKAAVNTAGFAMVQGDIEEGRMLCEEGLALAREAGDEAIIAHGLGTLAVIAGAQGNNARRTILHRESLALHRKLGNKGGMAGQLFQLGVATWIAGDFCQAMEYFEEAQVLARSLQNQKMIGTILLSMGNVAVVQGDYALGRAYYEEALALFRALDDRRYTAMSYSNLGILENIVGNDDRARILLEEALAIQRTLGIFELVLTLATLGKVAQNQGAYQQARTLYEEALAQRSAVYNEDVLSILPNLADVVCYEGDLCRAQALLDESLRGSRLILEQRGTNQGELSRSLAVAAKLAVIQEEPHRAARLFGAAEALHRSTVTRDVPLPLPDRPAYERAKETVRAQLGETAFAAAWSEGEQMTIQKAIEYALNSW